MSTGNQKLSDVLKNRIAEVANFPKPNILFKDVFPLLQTPSLLPDIIDAFHQHFTAKFGDTKVNAVAGLDARGFLFGPLLALKFNASFVPLRKAGKLPGNVISEAYTSGNGDAVLEIQTNAIKQGDNVLIVDDVFETGGTMACACNLVQKCGGQVLQWMCVVELTGSNGMKKLPKNTSFCSLVQYEF